MFVNRQSFPFLQSGGEMGGLIAGYDWSTTSLGPIERWSPCLRAHVGMMLSSRFPMLIFWSTDLITFYNDAFRPSLGNNGKHPSSLGQRGEESWAESWPVIGPMIYNIMGGGEAVWFEDQKLPIYREGKMGYAYWTYSFSPLRDDEEKLAGVLVTCSETTKAVESLDRLKELQGQQAMAIEAAELGTWEYNPAAGNFTANTRLREWFGLKPDEEIALPLAIEVIAEADRDRVTASINRAMEHGSGGRYEEEYTIVHPLTGEERIVQAKGNAQFDGEGTAVRLNGTLRDVTSQRRAEEALRASEAKFRALINEAPFATALYVGESFTIDLANDVMIKLWGKTPNVIGQQLMEALPELKDQPFLDLLREVRETGTTYSTKEHAADLVVDGQLQRFWFNFIYKPLFDEGGKVYAILNMAVDVSSQVRARKRLEEAELRLVAAIDVGQLATWDIDAKTKKITYSLRLQQWLGIEAGDYQAGSGSPNIIEADRARVNAAVQKALEPGGSGEMDETYTILNRFTGQRRVIHVNGKTLFDENGKPIVLTGTAQDVTLQQQLQLALENQVQQRTEELAAAVEELRATNEDMSEVNNHLLRSNEELAQYAYVASHDLQEPLRKIRIFSSQLFESTEVPSHLQPIVDKIQSSAERMSLLIQALLDFSRLLRSDSLLRPVNLATVVQDVLGDFELLIAEKEAEIRVGSLPVIEGVGLQMNQLFYNLIGNALKFTASDRKPLLQIEGREAKREEVAAHIQKPVVGVAYHHITVKDNGIGFDPLFLEQIFEVFKQLHGKHKYGGSGIGLAICRRVVQNHQGKIYAEAAQGTGATFHILLPEKQSNREATLPKGFVWKEN